MQEAIEQAMAAWHRRESIIAEIISDFQKREQQTGQLVRAIIERDLAVHDQLRELAAQTTPHRTRWVPAVPIAKRYLP